MPTIDDKEFGVIQVRRTANSRSMKATVATNGSLRVSIPSLTPLFMVKRMIASSRPQLRELLNTHPQLMLSDGMSIGKSHSLLVRGGATRSVRLSGQQLQLTLGPADRLSDREIVDLVRGHVIRILRREAKAHLPRRLRFVADRLGFDYTSLRFTHASTRWGSCNHNKAISLNIALMNLPFELIDYVLIHELAHTIHLDHSTRFWAVVEAADPQYKRHRKQLKSFNPGV
jgi:predicted metal-dependent hydrolase